MDAMNIIVGTLEINKVKIKKPIHLGNKHVYNIYYVHENAEKDMIIQTPSMILPYGTITSESGEEVQFDCCNDQFVKEIGDLRNHVIEKIRKTSCNLFENKFHADRIKDRLFGRVFRARIRSIQEIQIFDQHGKTLSPDCLRAERKVQLLLHIRWFWVSAEYYGLDYSIIQIKIDMPPQINLFVSEQDPFEKYHKMLKMKIPQDAVISKLKLDGFSEIQINDFKNKLSTTNTTHIAVQPPKCPPLPPPNPLGFLSQISKGNFKLKKTETIDNPETQKIKVMNKLSQYIDTNKKVPSLNDILSAKAGLRKV